MFPLSVSTNGKSPAAQPAAPRERRACGFVIWSLAILAPLPAEAVPIIRGLHRTGEGVVPVVASTVRGPSAAAVPIDPHWWVVALPETPTLVPYDAAVFSGRGPSFYVPPVWWHGVDGLDGAGWVGLRLGSTNSLAGIKVGPQSDYTAIYATTFTSSEAGTAAFDLSATADNALSFFVNGSVSGAGTLLPSIVGGAAIGVEQGKLDRLHRFQGFAGVRAGENTLYAVVRDRYTLNPTTNLGGYGQTGLFVAAVPEPGTRASLLIGGACLLIARGRFRRARAIQTAAASGRPPWSTDAISNAKTAPGPPA
jgi:hypothetical protein